MGRSLYLAFLLICIPACVTGSNAPRPADKAPVPEPVCGPPLPACEHPDRVQPTRCTIHHDEGPCQARRALRRNLCRQGFSPDQTPAPVCLPHTPPDHGCPPPADCGQAADAPTVCLWTSNGRSLAGWGASPCEARHQLRLGACRSGAPADYEEESRCIPNPFPDRCPGEDRCDPHPGGESGPGRPWVCRTGSPGPQGGTIWGLSRCDTRDRARKAICLHTITSGIKYNENLPEPVCSPD